jgi:methyltransferase (TIGR00027 family)
MFKELKRIAYQVNDMEKARQWYATLLGLEPAFDSPVVSIFKIGANTLSLARVADPVPEHDGRITGYWEVEDVDQAFARLLGLGARPKSQPTDVLTIRTAQVIDPFGNVIGLCGNIPHDRQLGIESQASQTAHAVALCRVLIAYDDRIEIRRQDPFSELFLATELRSTIHEAAKRQGIIDTRISRPLYGYFAARSGFFDDAFTRALRAQVPQIVLLGAGYDTRALRFQADLGTTQIFELDAPSTQGRKLEILRSSRTRVPPQVHFVGTNFKTDDLVERLQNHGYDPSLTTLFIWEGVTYYLPQETVDRTLELIRGHSASGSGIAFDYMTTKLDSINAGEPFLSWMAPTEMPGYLQRLGFRLIEHLDGPEMAKRYLTLADGTVAEKPLSAVQLVYGECADSEDT